MGSVNLLLHRTGNPNPRTGQRSRPWAAGEWGKLRLYLQPLPIARVTTWALPPGRSVVALDSHGSGNTDEASLLSGLLFTSYCVGTGHRPNRSQACPWPGVGNICMRGRTLRKAPDLDVRWNFPEDMKAEILLGIFRRGGREESFLGRKNHCQSEE